MEAPLALFVGQPMGCPQVCVYVRLRYGYFDRGGLTAFFSGDIHCRCRVEVGAAVRHGGIAIKGGSDKAHVLFLPTRSVGTAIDVVAGDVDRRGGLPG